MRFALAASVATALLVGCVADTMRSYAGQDIRAVELTYGPPINQIDLGNGTRAFQWSKVSVDTTPVSAVTTTDKDKKGRKTTDTQFVGGEPTVTRCLYTLSPRGTRRQTAGSSRVFANLRSTAPSAG